jgi:chromosome segregation ATPase
MIDNYPAHVMAHIAHIDCEAIRASFRQWQSELEPLEEQLSESLAALAAYQSHLDAWQQQLAIEREELNQARKQLEQNCAAAQQQQSQSQSETAAELTAALEKVSALSAALLARTEELRNADKHRIQAVNELEQMCTSEKELKAALNEQQQAIESERAQWAMERQVLMEQLEQRRGDSSPVPSPDAPPLKVVQAPAPPTAAKSADDAAESAVLGSILEQFGKLRQQRALERPALKKAR